jgi:hypothetical protein
MAESAHSAHLRDAAAAALDAPGEATLGFDIRLPSAQLADLIQINCMNRVRGAFRVTSAHNEGLLFFDAGQLVHAVTGEQQGLDAMVVMLGWRGGCIEPCNVPCPARGSIGMGVDALLLSAAQRLDERGRVGAHEEATTKVVRRIELPAGGPIQASEPTPGRASDHSGLALRSALSREALARLEVVRVATDGNIQQLRAGASTDLADTAFHCQTLASLIGDGLGLGACRALAGVGERDGIVVFTGRTIVGVRGQVTDLELVRAKVGLE